MCGCMLNNWNNPVNYRRMGVSRPTFQRILLSAGDKIAGSMANGKARFIDGGNSTQNICPARYTACGRKWRDIMENIESANGGEYVCPNCGSEVIICGHSAEAGTVIEIAGKSGGRPLPNK